MARIFVSGGSGLVGSSILSHEIAQKHEILAPRSSELNLLDQNAVETFIQDNRPDAIIHAAGIVGGIQANMREPVRFLDENTALGRNLIMSAYKGGVQCFLNIASTCIYPRAAKNPLIEEMVLTGELEPTNEGYALAKIMALRLCQYIHRIDEEFQYKTLIPCNLYGPNDTFDPEKSHLVPSIIHKLHQAKTAGSDTVEIWGDGTARREFMYAPDLADAIWRALTDIGNLPDLMNVGLGQDYSINDYYAIAAEVIGWEGSFTHDLSKPVGMKQKLCDTSKLNAWGWSAPTDIRSGIEKTYQAYLEKEQA